MSFVEAHLQCHLMKPHVCDSAFAIKGSLSDSCTTLRTLTVTAYAIPNLSIVTKKSIKASTWSSHG